jgi:hypothetical protein
MINLLPPDIKSNYMYARKNVSLRRWVILFAGALVGLGLITTYSLVSLHQSTVSYERKIAKSESDLKKEDYVGTQKEVQDISNSFNLVVKVLGQEVLFSKLLLQIGKTMPSKTALTGLTIAQTSGGIDITAVAIDYKAATQVQVNLADPTNKIFSKADITSIKCKGSTDPLYPCTVQIRALFSPNNPFLFINSKGTAKS